MSKYTIFLSIVLLLLVFSSFFNFTVYTIRKNCIDGVEYMSAGQSISVAYDSNGKVKVCK